MTIRVGRKVGPVRGKGKGMRVIRVKGLRGREDTRLGMRNDPGTTVRE